MNLRTILPLLVMLAACGGAENEPAGAIKASSSPDGANDSAQDAVHAPEDAAGQVTDGSMSEVDSGDGSDASVTAADMDVGTCASKCTPGKCGDPDGCGGVCGCDNGVCDPDSKLCCAGATIGGDLPKVYDGETTLEFAALGRGIDTAGNGLLAGACMETPPQQDPCAGSSAPTTTYYAKFAEDVTELHKVLKVSAEAAYGGPMYQASASADFAESTDFTSRSAFLVLNIDVTYGKVDLTAAKLKPEKVELLKKDPVGFFIGCGNQYVASMTKGGSFHAVVHFKGVDKSAKKALSAAFQGGSFDWSAGGSFSKAVSDAFASYETEVLIQATGAELQQAPLSVEGVIKAAKCFMGDAAAGACSANSKLTCASAKATKVTTAPYQAADGWPGGAKLPSTMQQREIIQETAIQAVEAQVHLNDIHFRLKNNAGKLLDPNAFPQCQPLKAKLDAQKVKLENFLKEAKSKVTACQVLAVCGPSPACLKPLPVLAAEDLVLPPMPKELAVQCGPNCTNGVPGSTFEVDSFGYCTKCTYDVPNTPFDFGTGAFANFDQPGKTFTELGCRFMRPGAAVHVAACGLLFNNKFVYPMASGVNLVLKSSDGAEIGHCSPSTPFSPKAAQYCYSNSNKYDNKVTYSLYDDAKVKPSDDNALKTAIVIKGCDKAFDNQNAKDFSCNIHYQQVKVCDVDAFTECGVSCNIP